MFWSGNYIANRELKLLLEEKNVTLTQVLEADDILQECKADNQALGQFLTRPDILAELITLITEEPPKDVKLSLQYRHANIASEVLTSNLSLLRARLSCNAVQMNRLCDFVSRDPPLNPLLASYFSKTIEMLFERSPVMDWYLHHIVCLRVLDFFKSRRDFLPNLLKHISTSAICDTFRCFLQTFKDIKIILEWLDEYQFLECLIQIICGTYDPEERHPPVLDTEEKASNESNEKLDTNHNSEPEKDGPVVDNKGAETNGERDEVAGGSGGTGPDPDLEGLAGDGPGKEERARRMRAVAASNAAALLCDIALDCALDPCNNYFGKRWGAGHELAGRLRSEETVRRVLQGCFTSPPEARRSAIVHTCRLLLALLHRDPPADAAPVVEAVPPEAGDGGPAPGTRTEADHGEVERAIAPHLPLLHHALLKDAHDDHGETTVNIHTTHHSPLGSSSPCWKPVLNVCSFDELSCNPQNPSAEASSSAEGRGRGRGAVGAARVHVAALVARLALSHVDDVPTALISLGTAGVLVELCLSCPHNNFLHAQLVAFVRNARSNQRFADRYNTHLIQECDLLTRLMDVFEENGPGRSAPRAGYMGHVVLVLRELVSPPPALPPGPLQQRWSSFTQHKLMPLLQLYDSPLGGVYPGRDMQEAEASYDALGDAYDMSEPAAPIDEDDGDHQALDSAKSNFLELAGQRFDENMWDDADDADDEAGETGETADLDDVQGEAQRVLTQTSPWEEAAGGAACGSSGDGGGGAGEGEGWAHFDTPFTGGDPFWGAPHGKSSHTNS
ncbi:LOW QUALITY PROTEIN: uncharacterized protein LOC116769479 [Danaus plexippus]|uniref:LOW QUALITY PROTEIN: uncharacterized protein LOC116769479 n=1 Tax=Danaus plexippus TaxID=13037 RepID=UPI002AB1DF3E|nr:LOW QUALITY PROTEIN: uncharacterized protein LOC116769479 [Danaus plexippus]